MSLLAADLRALANLPMNAVGRRMTLGLVVGLGLLSLMSWWLAKAVLDSVQMQRMMGLHAGHDVTARLIGYGLMTCPMVATWLGLATAQRQLFETPELMLWRQAPIAGFRGPMQIFCDRCSCRHCGRAHCQRRSSSPSCRKARRRHWRMR